MIKFNSTIGIIIKKRRMIYEETNIEHAFGLCHDDYVVSGQRICGWNRLTFCKLLGSICVQ